MRAAGASPRFVPGWGNIGITCVVAAIALRSTWEVLELRDPALMPDSAGSGAISGIGAAGAAAYAAWPASEPLPTKLVFFLTRLPVLVPHLTWFNWFGPLAFTLPVALVTAALASQLRSPAARSALVVVVACAVQLSYIAVYALCARGAVGGGAGGGSGGAASCQEYSPASWGGCPSCRQAAYATHRLMSQAHPLGGLFLLAFGLPPGPALAAVGACTWAGPVWGLPVVVRAAYGSLTESSQHAPVALTWRVLADAAAAQPLRLDVLVGLLLLPQLATLGLGWLLRARRHGIGGAAAATGGAMLQGSTAIAGGADKGAPRPPNAAGCSSPCDGEGPRGGAGAGGAAPPLPGNATPLAAPRAPAPVQRGDASCRPGASAAAVAAAALAAALEAAPPRRPPSLYRSPLAGRRAVLMVKADVRGADAHSPAAQALLAATLPGAVRQALLSVGATQPGEDPPVVLSQIGFRGCWAVMVNLAPWDPEGGGVAAVAAALPGLLPPEVQVLSVEAGHFQAPDASWLEPVCLPALGEAAEVMVALPRSLVEGLAADGCRLRALAAAPSGEAPVADVTLRPDGGGSGAAWPADGRVTLPLPRATGPMLHVALLRELPPPPLLEGGQAPGALPGSQRAFLGALPLLVLPPAECAELAKLWADMAALQRGALPPGASPGEVAAAAFRGDWAPFAYDFGAALARPASAAATGAGGALADVAVDVRECLAASGAVACVSLLERSWPELAQAAQPAAAPEEAEAAAPAPPPASAAGAAGSSAAACAAGLAAASDEDEGGGKAGGKAVAAAGTLGSGGGGDVRARALTAAESAAARAYAEWKVARLVATHDGWVHVFCVFMEATLVAFTAARGGTPWVLAAGCGQAVFALLPTVVFVLARGMYVRRRGAVWVASVLLHAATLPHVLAVLGEADALFAVAWVQRIWALMLLCHTAYPLLHQLAPSQQVLASVGQLYATHVIYHFSLGRSMPPLAYLLLPACGIAVASLSDWRMRVEWERSLALRAGRGGGR